LTVKDVQVIFPMKYRALCYSVLTLGLALIAIAIAAAVYVRQDLRDFYLDHELVSCEKKVRHETTIVENYYTFQHSSHLTGTRLRPLHTALVRAVLSTFSERELSDFFSRVPCRYVRDRGGQAGLTRNRYRLHL